MTSSHLPDSTAAAGEWQRLVFDFSLGNRDILWVEIDYEKFSHNMAKILGYCLATAATGGFEESEARALIASIFVERLTVEKIDMVSDEALNKLLGEPTSDE